MLAVPETGAAPPKTAAAAFTDPDKIRKRQRHANLSRLAKPVKNQNCLKQQAGIRLDSIALPMIADLMMIATNLSEELVSKFKSNLFVISFIFCSHHVHEPKAFLTNQMDS